MGRAFWLSILKLASVQAGTAGTLLKLLKLRWSFSWKHVGKGLKKQPGHSGNLWKGAVVGGGGLFSQHSDSWNRMCDQASGSAKEKK